MSDFASESGHWYHPSGEPCYTVVGKNGERRPTTLRDARKLGLFPSVTTIMGVAAAPALERWKRNQLLLAALTLPRRPHEPEEEWLSRVERDSRAEGRAAADRGSLIHGAIERFYRSEPVGAELRPWVNLAAQTISDICGPLRQWLTERSFSFHRGYGGKPDLYCQEWILDIKTKDGVEDAGVYDEHAMQLAAYRRAVCPAAQAGILFVDRNEPIVKFSQVTSEQLTRGLAMFDHLLAYWQAKTGHYPRGGSREASAR